MSNEHLSDEQEPIEEEGLSTGAQLGIAAFFVGLPLLELGVTTLGLGEAAMILAGLGAAGMGVGTKLLLDRKQEPADDEQTDEGDGRSATGVSFTQALVSASGLDRLQHADWGALLRPVGAPVPPRAALPHPQKGEEEAWYEAQTERLPEQVRQPAEKAGPWLPPLFRLEDVLGIIGEFNQQHCVYFGESEEGAIALPLSDMYHVIDVSSSGKGKSNRFRLAMMQMVNHCDTYYINPFAANVKAVRDERKIEVWKPIYDRLANKRPVKEGAEIDALMCKLVDEIARRNQQEEEGDFAWMDHPIFVFIDELPEVFARCPDAIKLLDKIGRTGRQFCVFAWIASQTALVSEIGQSTAAQANYKTRIYGGGDKTSSNRLMKGSLPQDAERTLQANGAGLTLMLADGMAGLSFVRAPLVTNEALFAYLGLPPFRKEDWMKGGKRKAPDDLSTKVRDLTLQQLLALVNQLPGSNLTDGRENDDEAEEHPLPGGSLSPEVPGNYTKPNLSVVPPLPGTSGELPENRLNAPEKQPELSSQAFEPGPDDLLLSELQADLLATYYRHGNTINESLKQIKNDKGQGLGARYQRHASYILEQRGLSKRRRA